MNAKVLIIGAGGLGAPAALYLAAAGVGTIGIADADVVDLSNLQRQVIHSTADIGRPKVESARDSMLAINPEITVQTYYEYITSENIREIIRDYDFILDGTDNFPAKFLINDACVLEGKPFSHAGIIRFEGQLMTYVPGQGPCYRCVFKEPPPKDAVPTCREAGVIGAVAGVIGCLQAMEAVKPAGHGGGQIYHRCWRTADRTPFDLRRPENAVPHHQPARGQPLCGLQRRAHHPCPLRLRAARLRYEESIGGDRGRFSVSSAR